MNPPAFLWRRRVLFFSLELCASPFVVVLGRSFGKNCYLSGLFG